MEKIRFHGLDHLRAIAIILVLMYHYRAFEHPSWIDTVGSVGWTGVDLFFVLSGFLISNELFDEIKRSGYIKPGIFFIKRFFRIVPPFLITLLLYFCIPDFREREALPPLWKFLTFTQNYGLDVINQGTFSHAWSLCIEEQFYLFLPLLLMIFIRSKSFVYLKFVVVMLMIIPVLFRLFSWYEFVLPNLNSSNFWKVWYMNIYYPTYTRFDGLVIGVLIGYLYQYSPWFRKMLNSNGNFLLLIGTAAIAFSFWICKDQTSMSASILGFSFVAISYGLTVMGAISKSSILGKKSCYITSQLATLSYAIYLSHKGVIHLTQRFAQINNTDISGNLVLILCFFLCIAVSLFYRYAVEKPAGSVKNKLLNLKK